MSRNTHTQYPLNAEIDAVELAGLALALRIVVTDYLSDPQPLKCNALDALSSVMLARANAHAHITTELAGCIHA